jgi:Zn-dependent M28 family amino/carboxypeptidase
VEYVDLVTDGTNSYLVINIKNIGNVPITTVKVSNVVSNVDCGITNVAPGGTASCTLDNTDISDLPTTAGTVWSGFVDITFSGGSTLSYAISARARSA